MDEILPMAEVIWTARHVLSHMPASDHGEGQTPGSDSNNPAYRERVALVLTLSGTLQQKHHPSFLTGTM